MKSWFAKRFYIVAIYWWCLWSRLYRFLYHRKYKNFVAPKGYLTIDEANREMAKLTWTKDGTKELWDSMGSDGWVQYVLNCIDAGEGQPVGALDCDDFSYWASRVLQDRYNAVIFVFSWISDKKLLGHAMCWCELDGSYVHIGNWGQSSPYNSLKPACVDILDMYSESSPIGWALLTNNLWPITWGVGLPGEEVTNGQH